MFFWHVFPRGARSLEGFAKLLRPHKGTTQEVITVLESITTQLGSIFEARIASVRSRVAEQLAATGA